MLVPIWEAYGKLRAVKSAYRNVHRGVPGGGPAPTPRPVTLLRSLTPAWGPAVSKRLHVMGFLQEYHHIWLRKHPDVTEDWLKDRLVDGFHVHHVDGDHSNNDPRNLVLIDYDDHMDMHALPMRRVNGVGMRKRKYNRKTLQGRVWALEAMLLK